MSLGLKEVQQPDPEFSPEAQAEVLMLNGIFDLPAAERSSPGEVRILRAQTIAGSVGYVSLGREMPKFNTFYPN